MVKQPVTPHELHEATRTLGQRIADGMARLVGSWPFVIAQSVILCGWIAFNVYLAIQIGEGNTFDPYPFILLNLVLSFQAAYTGPIIMISQNRQNHRDRLLAEHVYQVTMKNEMDTLRVMKAVNQLVAAQRPKG